MKINETTISRLENTEDIITIYKEYLAFMSPFFVVDDHDSWCEGALKNLKRYSAGSGRYIYIVKDFDSIIGFSFITDHLRFNDDGFAVADFYIQKDHEGKKSGQRLAEYVFEQFPGNWEVAVTRNNHSAYLFWGNVVASYTHEKFIKKRKSSFDGCGFLFNNA